MTKERKRGGLFPSGFGREESKLVGPFPPWDLWKHVVERKFGIDFKNSHRPLEPFLHDFYIIRRLQQKAGRINQEEVEEFWQRAEEEMPGFEEKYGAIIEFIINKTPIKTE